MDAAEKMLDRLENTEGILKVLELSKDTFKEIWDIERSVKTQTKHDYENIGFDEIAKRDRILCIYVDDSFRLEKQTMVRMVCDDGIVLGTTVLKEEEDSFRQRDDVLWVSEDFVVFTNVEGKGRERILLYPYEFPELSREVPGCTEVIGASPTPSSDEFLKHLASVPLSERIFTFLIGFNCRFVSDRCNRGSAL